MKGEQTEIERRKRVEEGGGDKRIIEKGKAVHLCTPPRPPCMNLMCKKKNPPGNTKKANTHTCTRVRRDTGNSSL